MTNDAQAQASELLRSNLSTLIETRDRLLTYGKRTSELDGAIDETTAFLERARTAPSPAGAGPSCDDMLAEAERLATQIGYMVVPDPVHADGEVHAPDFVIEMQPSLRALGFHAVPLNDAQSDGEARIRSALVEGE